MAKATWKGVVIAQSDKTVVVEGNHYFPPDSLNMEALRMTDTHTTCSWKGEASYYDVIAGDEVNKDAAWVYPKTLPEADNIRGYVAFWRGVEVSSS